MNFIAKAWGLPEDDPAVIDARRQVALLAQFHKTAVVAVTTEIHGSLVAVHYVFADGHNTTIVCNPAEHRACLKERRQAQLAVAAEFLDHLNEV